MNDKRDTANKGGKAPTGAKDPSKRKKSKAATKKKDNTELEPTEVGMEKEQPGEPGNPTTSSHDEGSDAEP